jgi:hypothetical protein
MKISIESGLHNLYSLNANVCIIAMVASFWLEFFLLFDLNLFRLLYSSGSLKEGFPSPAHSQTTFAFHFSVKLKIKQKFNITWKEKKYSPISLSISLNSIFTSIFSSNTKTSIFHWNGSMTIERAKKLPNMLLHYKIEWDVIGRINWNVIMKFLKLLSPNCSKNGERNQINCLLYPFNFILCWMKSEQIVMGNENIPISLLSYLCGELIDIFYKRVLVSDEWMSMNEAFLSIPSAISSQNTRQSKNERGEMVKRYKAKFTLLVRCQCFGLISKIHTSWRSSTKHETWNTNEALHLIGNLPNYT